MDTIKLKSILSSDVISVTQETPLSKALSILSEKKISCLLVVENNKPIGILTERDVVKIVAGGKNIVKMKLAQAMSSPVITVQSGMDIFEGYTMLREGKIRHLVVTDEQGDIEGLVTHTDIIKELKIKLINDRSVFEIITRKSEERIIKINQCLLNLGADFGENINSVTKLCGELMNATCALYNSLDKGLLCSVGQWQTPPNYNPKDKAEGHLCYDVIKKGKDSAIVVKDLPSSKYADTDPNVKSYKLKTYVGHSVKCGKDFVGSLCAVFQQDISLTDDDMKIMGILAVAIGKEEERKRSEAVSEQFSKKLVESQQKDRVWLENSPVCTKIVDLDFNLQYMSVAGIKALKVDDVSQLYGTPYPFNFFPESTKKSMAKILEKVKKTGEIITAEAPVADIDGNEMWFQATFVPIKDNEGRIEYIIVVSVDINDRKKMEEELEKYSNHLQELVDQRTSELQEEVIEHIETERDLDEARELAEKANRAKSKFLSRMSHEIRTPMNSILGCSELLGKTSLNDMQKDFLKRVSGSGKLLLGIIDDILDFSKFEFGKIKLESTPFNLEELIIDVFKIIVSRMKDNPFDTYIDIDDAVPEYVVGDPTRLKQILVNLLGNAVKFTSQGDIGVIVSVEDNDNISPDYCHLRFTVKDTGVGIPREKQANIFESFAQADDSTTRLYGGTGLGLSICKSLVSAMDGTIWVESEPGKGSEFIFVVKMKKEKDVKEYNIEENIKIKLNETGVFIVDDNETSRMLIKKCCEEIGLKIIDVADSPHSALDKLEKLVATKGIIPNLFLSDIRMEGMNGFELVRKIRKNENFKNAKFIAVTADMEAESSQKTDEESFDKYIIKPVNVKELYRTIIKILDVAKEDEEEKLGEEESCADINILVVEDAEENQIIIKYYCDDLGCKADYAMDGKEAIEKLKSNQYDLCLMDIHMPVMGGINATKIIRKEISKNLPIIALTAAVMSEDQEEAMAAGMNDFLRKPIDTDKLRETILRYGRKTST